MFLQILTIIVPIFFVLLLGYAAGRARAFDSDQVAGINELVLDFAVPASLFVGTMSTPRTHWTHHRCPQNYLEPGSRREYRAQNGGATSALLTARTGTGHQAALWARRLPPDGAAGDTLQHIPVGSVLDAGDDHALVADYASHRLLPNWRSMRRPLASSSPSQAKHISSQRFRVHL